MCLDVLNTFLFRSENLAGQLIKNILYIGVPTFLGSDKGAGASEAGGQTKEGPLSKRYFQTSKIAQNRTKSPVPIVIDVFGVTAPYGNPYGSKIAIVWLFFVIF